MKRSFDPRYHPVTPLLLVLVLVGTVAAAAPQAPPQATAPQPPAQFAVSPGKFDIPIGTQSAVEAIQLMNFSDRDVRIAVSVQPWNLDTHNRVQPVEATEQTLDQWLVFNPRRFTVPARSSQTVRFAIRPRVKPQPGEHRAMIYFQEVPRESNEHSFQVVFRVGVAVYAYAGPIERVGKMEAMRVVADARILSASFDIASLGNAHVRMHGQYAIWPRDRFPGASSLAPLEGIERPDFVAPEPIVAAGLLPNTPVLPGTRREIALATHHSLPPGNYVFAALGHLGDQEFRRITEFRVPSGGPIRVAGQGQGDGF